MFLTNFDDDWKNNSVSGTISFDLKTRHNAMKATKQKVNKMLKYSESILTLNVVPKINEQNICTGAW